MSANGFQNMLMITAGAKAPGVGMGKTTHSGSTGADGEFAALLASLGTQTNNKGFTGLGREINDVLRSLTDAAQKTTETGEQNLMALMGLDGTPGRKTQAVISALTQSLTGEAAGKPQDLFVDSQGLDALAGLLGAAGFDTEKIASFIKDKKQGMSEGASMSTPFQSLLTSLGEFMKANDQGETWDISTLPHVQSALTGFGMNQEEVERIMDRISGKREGVDVDQLLAALAPFTGNAGQIPGALKGDGRENSSRGQGENSLLPVLGSRAASLFATLTASDMSTAFAGAMGPEEVLNQAVTGKMTLDRFVSELNSLTKTVEPGATAQKSLAENFAAAFAGSLQTHKQTTVKEGSQAWTTVDIAKPEISALRFDTKKPMDSMFTENGDGLFKGNLKGATQENTWTSAPGTEAGKKQPDFDGVLKNMTNDDSASTESGPDLENTVTLVKAAARGKNSLNHDSGESSQAVKSLTGTGFYSKTADMTQAGASEKTLPAYVTDQVARQISKAVRNGDSEIRFHIKPPDMGRVELSIATTASGLKISIFAEHSATRDMLMNQTTDLRTILADQGIRIEKMDVGLSGNFGQNMAQARHDSDQSGKGRKQKDKPLFTLDTVNGESRGNTVGTRIKAAGYIQGKLDLVA